MRRFLAVAGVSLVTACSAGVAASAPPSLTFLGGATVPSGFSFGATVVGGLSGISYDPGRDLYYVISDDRSAKSPARFYTVGWSVADKAPVDWVAATALSDTDGRPFEPGSPAAEPPVLPPDPEGIAFDAQRQEVFWSSEGARDVETPGRPLLLDPWVRAAGLDGSFRGQFPLPPDLVMSAGPSGPRANTALEGLTVTPGGAALFAAMEGPLWQDGEPPTDAHGALTRVTRFDTGTGRPTAQYAYPVDPVSAGPGGDNGLSDLVALDDENFLVVERGYGDRVAVRIYRATIAGADNVIDRPSLTGTPKTMTKELVADLSTVAGIDHLDNVEGITLGPKRSDGRTTVVMVTDDNFSAQQVTQFLAFAW